MTPELRTKYLSLFNSLTQGQGQAYLERLEQQFAEAATTLTPEEFLVKLLSETVQTYHLLVAAFSRVGLRCKNCSPPIACPACRQDGAAYLHCKGALAATMFLQECFMACRIAFGVEADARLPTQH